MTSSPERIEAPRSTSTPTPATSAAPAAERLISTFANNPDVAATIGAILRWVGEFHKHYGKSDGEQWLADNPPPAIAPEAWGMDENEPLRDFILGLVDNGLVEGITCEQQQLSLTADAIWKYCRTDLEPVNLHDFVWRKNNQANSGKKPTRQGLLELLETNQVTVLSAKTPPCPDRAKAGAIEDLVHKLYHATGEGPNRATIYARIKGKERVLRACIQWLLDVERLVDANGKLEPTGGDRESL
jgi:hypothetical protein